jgi:hypothetical protein
MSRLRRAPRARALVLLLVLVAAQAARADEPLPPGDSQPLPPRESRPLPPGAEGELLRAEALRQRALVDADLPALQRLLADELRFVHSNGRADTKPALLDALGAGRLDYVSARARDVVARVYGDAGVVAGSTVLEVRAAGAPSQPLRNVFTAVYARRDGAWRLVAYQSTRAPDEPGG